MSTVYESYLHLKNIYYEKLQGLEKKIMGNFMDFLISEITINTSLSYHKLNYDETGNIIILIQKLENKTNKQINNRDEIYNEFIQSKINELKEFLEEKINYNNILSSFKLIISAIVTYDFDFNKMFYIHRLDTNEKIPVKLKKPNFNSINYKELKENGLEILDVYSEFTDDSLILLDFTRPYEEMGFEYNALHLFEHLITIPFMRTTRNPKNIIIFNGYTTKLGQAVAFIILKNKESFEYYLNELFKHLNKMRDLKYWENEEDPEIILQIKRTISETKKEPSYTNFAKSSNKSYELKLNKHVFHYWANQPMKLTLIHPFKNYKYPKIEFKELEEVSKPKIPKFDYIPYEVIYEKSTNDLFTKKVQPEKIAKKYLKAYESNDFSKLNGVYGLDVCLSNINGDLNRFIHDKNPLLTISTFRDYYDKEDFKKLLVYFLSIYHSNTLYFKDV